MSAFLKRSAALVVDRWVGHVDPGSHAWSDDWGRSRTFSAGIAVPPIIAWVTGPIETYVKPALRGEMIASLAVTEPGAGSDVSGVTLKRCATVTTMS